MRINDSNQTASTVSQSQAAAVKGTTQPGKSRDLSGAADRNGDDQVSLSGISQMLGLSSATRADQISRLTSLVRSGQYQVSSAALSQSIVSEGLARSGAI